MALKVCLESAAESQKRMLDSLNLCSRQIEYERNVFVQRRNDIAEIRVEAKLLNG